MSAPIFEGIKTTTSQPFHELHYIDIFCEACAQDYKAFLQNVVAQQQPLSDLYTMIMESGSKRSRRQLEALRSISTILDPSQCIISTAFVNSLKVVVRGRRRYLAHPDRCTCHQWAANRVEIDPTKNLLCVSIMN